MPTITMYPASETPYADLGWRDMSRMFSRNPHDRPERRNFGVLHVFNAGTIQPRQGYPMHPHDNVEIVTIPVRGTWEHKDTAGNARTFGAGHVQSITAGTGLAHSEFNASGTEPLTTMQFWLYTRTLGLQPRYDLYDYAPHLTSNELIQVASPNPDDAGVHIEQDAWFSLGRFDAGAPVAYNKHSPLTGTFVYVIRGEFKVLGHLLSSGDAMGIEGADGVTGHAHASDSELLVIEVPMEIDPDTVYA